MTLGAISPVLRYVLVSLKNLYYHWRFMHSTLFSKLNYNTPQAVNAHLDILRPAIKNYGGSVEVVSIEGKDCVVKYIGPESIGSGIKAAIKEKFSDISNVVLTD